MTDSTGVVLIVMFVALLAIDSAFVYYLRSRLKEIGLWDKIGGASSAKEREEIIDALSLLEDSDIRKITAIAIGIVLATLWLVCTILFAIGYLISLLF